MRLAVMLLAVGAVTLVGAAPVTAVTIGFEVAPVGLFVVPATPYLESGFTFTSSFDPAPLNGIFDGADPFSNTNGTDIFSWCADDCPGTQIITVIGPSTFSITSIDIGFAFSSRFTTGMSVGLTGFFAGGGLIFVSLPVAPAWATHALSGFTGLASLDIVAVDPTLPGFPAFPSGIDNLVLSTGATAPEPSAMLLLAVGLIGLGWRRFRAR